MTRPHSTTAMSTNHFALKPLVAALLCLGYSAATLAQDSVADTNKKTAAPSITLETVNVTAEHPAQAMSSEKFTAPLLDTPQTLQIISSEVFTQQGANNLTDVLSNTPGISFNAGENGFSTSNNNFSMRGFDTSGSIFIDGSRDLGSYTRDVFNIEQVEVAKGPAADNGRGSSGGYINLQTKTPKLDNFYRFSTSYGFDDYSSQDRKRVSADINQRLGDLDHAFRLNLMLEDSGFAGRKEAEKDSWGIAPSIAFGLSTPTRLILATQHVKHDDRPDWGLPAAMISGTHNYNPMAASADRDNFYGLDSDYDQMTSDTVTVRLEHDFSDNITFSNQTRWSQTDHQAQFTVPTGYNAPAFAATTQTQMYDRESRSFSNLSNLNLTFTTGFIKHDMALGLEFSREKANSWRFGTRNAPITDILKPNPHRTHEMLSLPSQSNEVAVSTRSLYINDTLTFNEYWQLTGGLRFERYNVDIDSRTLSGLPTGNLDGYDESESTVGGKLGLVYKPSKNGSIYLAYGRSTLPAGSFLSNSDISRTGDNAFPGFVEDADVQRSTNIELGTKWNFFNDRLMTSAAYFHTEKSRVAITGRDPGETQDSLKGYGRQIVKGLELSVSGQITDNWAVYAGAVFMDSERRHSAYLDSVRRRANPADYTNSFGTVYRTDGDELAFTPKQSSNLWTTYDFDFGLTVGGGIRHVSEAWVGRPDDANRIIPNGKYGKMPDYTVVDLLASYKLNNHVTLRLNIDNVTNELYATSMNWAATRALVGSPRTYMLSADFSF